MSLEKSIAKNLNNKLDAKVIDLEKLKQSTINELQGDIIVQKDKINKMTEVLESKISLLDKEIDCLSTSKEFLGKKNLKKLKGLISKERYYINRQKKLEQFLGNINIYSSGKILYVTNVQSNLSEFLTPVGFKKVNRKNPANGIKEEMYIISKEYFDKYSLVNFLSALIQNGLIK